MSNNNSIKRKEFQQLKGVKSFFDKEALPEVKKDINEILEELDAEVAEYKKRVEENDRIILETMSYEQFLKLSRLV